MRHQQRPPPTDVPATSWSGPGGLRRSTVCSRWEDGIRYRNTPAATGSQAGPTPAAETSSSGRTNDAGDRTRGERREPSRPGRQLPFRGDRYVRNRASARLLTSRASLLRQRPLRRRVRLVGSPGAVRSLTGRTGVDDVIAAVRRRDRGQRLVVRGTRTVLAAVATGAGEGGGSSGCLLSGQTMSPVSRG